MLTLLALTALAQDPLPAGAVVPTLNSQLFHHSVDSRQTIWTDDAGTILDPGAPLLSARIGANGVDDPLVVHWQDDLGTGRAELVSQALQFDFIGSIQTRGLRLGVDVPVFALATSEVASDGGGLGDLAVDVRATVAPHIALAGRVGFATATVDVPLRLPDGTVMWELTAIVDQQLGPVLLAFNAGARGEPASELDNVVWGTRGVARAGAGWALWERSGLSADAAASASFQLAENPGHGASIPLELLGGAWHEVTPEWVLRGGVGKGLTRGIGAPNARIVASLEFRPERAQTDERVEAAVAPAATVVTVPRIVEVRVVDPDGTDIIGALVLVNGDEASPGELVIDKGLHQLTGWAPGYRVAKVDVSAEPGERIPVVIQLEPSIAELQGEQIELREEVHFDTAAATIQVRSHELLDHVAEVLEHHPEIELLRIEGHTDSRGGSGYNLDLSERRANEVRLQLIERDIDPARLRSVGYGETKPLSSDETEAAWADNRRVEMWVERWEEDEDGQ